MCGCPRTNVEPLDSSIQSTGISDGLGHYQFDALSRILPGRRGDVIGENGTYLQTASTKLGYSRSSAAHDTHGEGLPTLRE
jgi:hypothetical protein